MLRLFEILQTVLVQVSHHVLRNLILRPIPFEHHREIPMLNFTSAVVLSTNLTLVRFSPYFVPCVFFADCIKRIWNSAWSRVIRVLAVLGVNTRHVSREIFTAFL